MIETCSDLSSNVKRWRDGDMVLRWCAAGMLEAAKQFRRVNGFLHPPALRAALQAHVAEAVTPIEYNKRTPPEHNGLPPKFHGTRDNLPGTGHTCRDRLRDSCVQAGHRVAFATAVEWVARLGEK